MGWEVGEAKSIGEVGPKQSKKSQGVVARGELERGRTTMSIWGPVVVSKGPEVVAACEGQRKVGADGAGLIATLEDPWHWVGGFGANRGCWGGVVGVRSMSRDEFGFQSQLWHQRANKFWLGGEDCSCEAWCHWTVPESGKSP